MDPKINCKQKQRSNLPKQAISDINSFKMAGVFENAEHGIDQYCANLTLVIRPNKKEFKGSNKADTWLAKVSNKSKNLENNNQDEPVRYRTTIDFRSCNLVNLSPTVVSLPSLVAVEAKL